MIEEIKKEIEPLLVLDDVLYCKDCGSRNIKKSYKPYKIGESIMKILDKYKEQDKYKNAWNELKEDCREVEKDNDYILYERLQQLEQKHNIGVDIDE